MKLQRVLHSGLAILAGAGLTLAFAPFHLFLLAVISPAILLFLWSREKPARAFLTGFLYGIGHFATGIYWVYISVHIHGNTNVFLALLITALFVALLALFPALTGYLLNRTFPVNNAKKLLFGFPFLWVLFEWIRSWLFTGFPWLLLGNSQIYSPLKGYGPIVSVYGISLLVLVCSGLLVNFYLQRAKWRAAFLNIIVLFGIGFTGSALSFVSWTYSSGTPMQVALVQGNIEQSVKWEPGHVQFSLDRYTELTEPYWNTELIVWPESAVPVPFHVASEFLNAVTDITKKTNATLITGIPIKASQSGYYNAMITLGAGTGTYYKYRLVPFGEFIPFKNSLGKLLDLLEVPMSDFIQGPVTPQPINVNGKKIAAFICYEIAYPEQVRLFDQSVDLILTISNDGWFGRSIAQAQHLEIAQMRALEMGRPILFAGNDGITAIIDHKGQIQSQVPPFEAAVLIDKIQPMQGQTPWQRMGMGILLAIFFILLLTFQCNKMRQRWKNPINRKK